MIKEDHPLDFLAGMPNAVTMLFGLEFIDELRELRHTCQRKQADLAAREKEEQTNLVKDLKSLNVIKIIIRYAATLVYTS